jgi:hypothetical protein
MAKGAMASKDNSQRESKPQPYAPSWIDRFNAWVGRLPGPSWSYYLGLGLVLLFVQAIVLWIEGAFPIGTVHPVHGFLAVAIPYLLALFHYLDERSGAALATLRPALKASEEEYQKMHYQLTTLPAGSTLLASLAVLTIVFLTELTGEPYRLEALDTFPISANLLRFFYLIIWWVFAALLYHTVHQLRLINRIYTKHTHINLFRMKPLYAFANLTAFTAGSLTIMPYGFLIVNQIERIDPVSLVLVLIIQFVAVVAFIWPQLGIHRLQAAEKERLLDEANQRFEAAIVELHQRMDNRKLEGMTDLNMAIASLKIELNALKRISTWPWEPETIRVLITALALPLGLWGIQFFLQRVLGP